MRSVWISMWGRDSETEKSQSAKIWLNFNFGGGGYFETSDLDPGKKVGKLDFGGGILKLWIWTQEKNWKFGFGGVGGYSETEKSQSAKIWLNFNFRGGGGYSKTSDLDPGKKVGKLDFGGVF